MNRKPLNVTLKCLSCWGIAIDVTPDKNHKPINVILKCLSCWCIAIDVNPDMNHKPPQCFIKMSILLVYSYRRKS